MIQWDAVAEDLWHEVAQYAERDVSGFGRTAGILKTWVLRKRSPWWSPETVFSQPCSAWP